MTIDRNSVIEPPVFNTRDTQRLVAALLVLLATQDDEFAQKVLDENFPADDEGNFHWPGPDSRELGSFM